MLCGAPYIVAIIDIPQRFQTFGHSSALGAGVRLIPFNGFISFGTVAISIVVARTKIPPIFLLLVGAALQITGVSLISTIKSTDSVPKAIYGYQVMAGLGIGIFFGLCLVLPPAVARDKDLGKYRSPRCP
jgi:hypothetical protein